MAFSFIDFYTHFRGHPYFNDGQIIQDDTAQVIIQKYQMVIFTNRGDVYDMPTLGANLQELLHETKYSAEDVKSDIISQINLWVPELSNLSYQLEVNFFEHPERFEEFMVIDLSFNGWEISTVVQ